MPSISATQEVIKALGFSWSIYIFVSPSPRFYEDLTSAILDKAAVSLQDDSVSGLDTTILDLQVKSPKFLRQGAPQPKQRFDTLL